MTNYTRTKVNYRKIYEHHYGAIPLDQDCRKYEIHHVDGNSHNNSPNNLKALTIQEHFELHLAQGDLWACLRIAQKMQYSSDQISAFSSQLQKRRIQDGTHNFLDTDANRERSLRRVQNGTHHFLGDRNPVHKAVEEGTHNFIGGEIQRRHNQRRIADGTHHLLSGDIQREAAINALANGTHPSQIQRTCDRCGKVGHGSALKRWHFDNCRSGV